VAGCNGRLGFVTSEYGQLGLDKRDLPGQICRVNVNNALFNVAHVFLGQQA